VNINKKKLEMLEEFQQLEQKREQIATQMQQLQNYDRQAAQRMDTLNKQLALLVELENKDTKTEANKKGE